MDVTVVVPTLNRPDFVGRLLHYYAAVGFKGQVHVGDSSTAENAEQIRDAVRQVESRVAVRYVSCTGLNDSQAIRALLEQADTAYAAFVADDDFLTPGGLQRAVTFLDAHPDYSVAHGEACLFELGQSGPYGEIVGTGAYALPEFEAATAGARLVSLMGRYGVTLFSVHRLNQFRRSYAKISEVPDKSFTEVLPVCHSAIQGKGKRLDGLYLVRQAHEARYLLPDVFDWLTGGNWRSSFIALREDLADALVTDGGMERTEALSVVKLATWTYMAKALPHKLRQRDRTMATSDWRGVLSRIPLAQAGWKQFARIAPGRSLSLSALLSPSSPYHADFMPVHAAVTGKRPS